MSEKSESPKYLDAEQLVFLPRWARLAIAGLLGFLALAACISATAFLLFPNSRELVVPAMSIAQTAIGGFAVVLFVLFSEKQLSTHRLHEKTAQFLDLHVVDTLSKIELPQIAAGKTVTVSQTARGNGIHGGRKDIYGSTYTIQMGEFKMNMWVGINVRRLSAIYFVKATSSNDAVAIQEAFHFSFAGAEKVGYHTNYEYALIGDEHIVSIWSTVFADKAILGDPTEQLFWIQDLAMMTQSVARTAIRKGWSLNTLAEPGPL